MAMFDDLATGDMNLQQIAMSKGYSLREYRNLVSVIHHRRSDWLAAYRDARAARVLRFRCRLLDTPDEKLSILGRSGINKAKFQIESARPAPVRRAEAKAARAERAARDPLYAAHQRAKRRAPA
jgi:hypothetical protein